MTQKEFIDYLKGYNITEEANGELYTTLMVKFDSQMAGLDELFGTLGDTALEDTISTIEQKGGSLRDIVSQTMQSADKGEAYLVELGFDEHIAETMVAQIQAFLSQNEFVIEVIGTINYQKMVGQYGTEGAVTGKEFLEQNPISTNPFTNEEAISAISGGDVSTVTSAQQLLAQLVNETGIEYNIAMQYVLDYVKAVGQSDIVNKRTLTGFSSLNNILSKTKYLDKYSNTIKKFKGQFFRFR